VPRPCAGSTRCAALSTRPETSSCVDPLCNAAALWQAARATAARWHATECSVLHGQPLPGGRTVRAAVRRGAPRQGSRWQNAAALPMCERELSACAVLACLRSGTALHAQAYTAVARRRHAQSQAGNQPQGRRARLFKQPQWPGMLPMGNATEHTPPAVHPSAAYAFAPPLNSSARLPGPAPL
jgi:hypothetical protein